MVIYFYFLTKPEFLLLVYYLFMMYACNDTAQGLSKCLTFVSLLNTDLHSRRLKKEQYSCLFSVTNKTLIIVLSALLFSYLSSATQV